MVKRALLATFFTACMGTVGWAAAQAIPAGTILNCRLSQPLSTKLDSRGQGFSAAVSEPLVANGVQIIPYGATISGRISSLRPPGRILGAAAMVLTPETIAMPDGRTYPLSAVLVTAYGAPGTRVVDAEGTLQGPSGRWGQVKEIGLGMGGGGFLGALLGGAHGAVLGLAIGGAAGFVDRIRRGVPNLSLPSGTELKFQLSRALAISKVTEYNLSSASRYPRR
jgi:hypothetical protein